MTMTPDLRFKVQVTNTHYTSGMYVKMDRGMFRMLQFPTTPNYGDNSFITAHRGRRFHGQILNPDAPDALVVDSFMVQGLSLEEFLNDVNQRGRVPLNADGSGNDGVPAYAQEFSARFISNLATRTPNVYVTHTAQMCCADATRIREIVFTSDMSVKSEGNAEAVYKRFLCDFQVFNPTNITYNISTYQGTDPYSQTIPAVTPQSSFTETLPSHRIYTSENASAGRWQELLEPSALWEVQVRAMVRCWDYERNEYKFESIPLPAGMQFSVKLIFVSKENHVVSLAEKPDKYHA